MEGLSSRVRESANRVNQQLSSTTMAVRAVRSSWKGSAQEAFAEHYSGLERKTKQINNDWSGLSSRLQELSRCIQRAEREKQEKMRAAAKR